jgi:hypothetical protein
MSHTSDRGLDDRINVQCSVCGASYLLTRDELPRACGDRSTPHTRSLPSGCPGMLRLPAPPFDPDR